MWPLVFFLVLKYICLIYVDWDSGKLPDYRNHLMIERLNLYT